MSTGVKICTYAIIFHSIILDIMDSKRRNWTQKKGGLPSQKYIHRDEGPRNEQPDWHTHSISEIYENIPL